MSVQDVRGMQKCYEGLVRVSSEVSKHADGNSSCNNFLLHFMFFLWDVNWLLLGLIKYQILFSLEIISSLLRLKPITLVEVVRDAYLRSREKASSTGTQFLRLRNL